MSEKLIQSYVKESFFVSTIHRKSSTIPPLWYYETIVWEWNKGTRQKGEMLTQHDSGISENYAIDDHTSICIKLLEDM